MNRRLAAAAIAIAALFAAALQPLHSAAASARISAVQLGIIPLPRSVKAYAATYAVPARVRIAAASYDERNVAGFAIAFLKRHGVSATIVRPGSPAQVRLTAAPHATALGNEGYHLHVGSDGIAIRANAGAGLFYGLQTLEQLFPVNGPNVIHEVEIDDAPAYPYRGMHLDVSRHFYPVSFVEKYIDLESRYKLNVFHWHLTDDQGWRIQIKRYPKLTTIGDCRDGTMIDHDFSSNDHKRYCGYYTQAQIRQVVAYAKRRYVTIVPEIEMPGHSVEVLAAYPQFACFPGHYHVRTTWGVSNDIVCPSEQTIQFYENVLTEVMQLFPGPYIHTGGDEAPKVVWDRSPLVHAIMRKHHLANSNAVQGWFDTRIEAFLRAHGRRMIGWDEILEGNVTRSAIVMSWRGMSGGIIAATRGNDVILTPDGTLYFDAAQGDQAYEPLNIGGETTLQDVYDFDPTIDGLTPEQQKHVLGAQANLWTEYITTPSYVEYMLLPRMLALAELVWTPSSLKDWNSFVDRTSNQYARFEKEGVQFRIPEPIGLQDTVMDGASTTISLRSPVPGATMFYTTDGSMPTTSSARYTGPFVLHVTPGGNVTVRVITVLRSGRVSAPAPAIYERPAAVPVIP